VIGSDAPCGQGTAPVGRVNPRPQGVPQVCHFSGKGAAALPPLRSGVPQVSPRSGGKAAAPRGIGWETCGTLGDWGWLGTVARGSGGGTGSGNPGQRWLPPHGSSRPATGCIGVGIDQGRPLPGPRRHRHPASPDLLQPPTALVGRTSSGVARRPCRRPAPSHAPGGCRKRDRREWWIRGLPAGWREPRSRHPGGPWHFRCR